MTTFAEMCIISTSRRHICIQSASRYLKPNTPSHSRLHIERGRLYYYHWYMQIKLWSKLVNLQFSPGLLVAKYLLNRERSRYNVHDVHNIYRLMRNYQSNALCATSSKNATTGTVQFGNWIITKRCWKYENNIATPLDIHSRHIVPVG